MLMAKHQSVHRVVIYQALGVRIGANVRSVEIDLHYA
jgi:hypothetical protein